MITPLNVVHTPEPNSPMMVATDLPIEVNAVEFLSTYANILWSLLPTDSIPEPMVFIIPRKPLESTTWDKLSANLLTVGNTADANVI